MSDLDTLKVEAEAVSNGRKYNADATFNETPEGLRFSEANVGTTSAPRRGEQQTTWSVGVTANSNGVVDGIQAKFESSPSQREVVLGTTTQDFRLADGSIRKIELPSISSNYDAGVDRAAVGATVGFKPVELVDAPQVTGTPFVGVAVGKNANGQVAGTAQAGIDINGGITVGSEVRVDKTPGNAVNTTGSPLIDAGGSGNVLGSTMDRLYAPTPTKHDSSLLNNLSPGDKKLYNQAVSGVEKLNAQGAAMPVPETAASLLALAKKENVGSIDYVVTGKHSASGKENIFIGTGAANNPAGDKTFISKQEAAQTSIEKSLQIVNVQNELAPQQANAKVSQEKVSEQISNPTRAI